MGRRTGTPVITTLTAASALVAALCAANLAAPPNNAPAAPADRAVAKDWSPAPADPPDASVDDTADSSEAGREAGLRSRADLDPALWRHVDPVCADGDGARVVAVYAREAGRPDRYARVAPVIRDELARIDDVFAVSAAKTGGGRRVRWYGKDCRIGVLSVVVPRGTFAKPGIETTEAAMTALGLADRDRKYLVFADAARQCGVATIYRDSSPTANANDGRNPQHARLDVGCWSTPAWSAAVHELVHLLGGVQPDAPHALGRYHCSDAHDVMCYRESESTVLTEDCPASEQGLLDCGNDDYFSTAPARGSYLSRRWNTANSRFLAKVPVLQGLDRGGVGERAATTGTVRLPDGSWGRTGR